MEESARHGSLALESVAKALAEWSVLRQEELDPTLPQRYGASWRRDWVGDSRVRLRQLAQAIAVRRPAVFAEAVAWSAASFAARGLGTEDLKRNLECLAEVLEDRLPAAVAAQAAPCLEAARSRLEQGDFPAADEPPALEPAALRYLEALLSGRRRDAEAVVLEAAQAGRAVADVYRDILLPAQIEVGRMWHAGEIGVAEEHLATVTTETVMSRLRERLDPPAPARRRVVAASVAGELHVLGVRAVADFFEMDGWHVMYLGGDVPADDLVRCVVEHDADLLALSVTNVLHLRRCGELIDSLRQAGEARDTKVIVGGTPFRQVPDLWKELGADGTADSAEEAVALGNRLVPAREVDSKRP